MQNHLVCVVGVVMFVQNFTLHVIVSFGRTRDFAK